jgi:hypothetical protein
MEKFVLSDNQIMKILIISDNQGFRERIFFSIKKNFSIVGRRDVVKIEYSETIFHRREGDGDSASQKLNIVQDRNRTTHAFVSPRCLITLLQYSNSEGHTLFPVSSPRSPLRIENTPPLVGNLF